MVVGMCGVKGSRWHLVYTVGAFVRLLRKSHSFWLGLRASVTQPGHRWWDCVARSVGRHLGKLLVLSVAGGARFDLTKNNAPINVNQPAFHCISSNGAHGGTSPEKSQSHLTRMLCTNLCAGPSLPSREWVHAQLPGARRLPPLQLGRSQRPWPSRSRRSRLL